MPMSDATPMPIEDRLCIFMDRSQRMFDAVGDPFPQWNEAVRLAADRALEGVLCLASTGELARVGLSNIDWSCAATHNPPVVEMALRRFTMIGPLASAWRATGDQKYAHNARVWMEAFLDDHDFTHPWTPLKGDGVTQYDLRIGTYRKPGWLGALYAFHDSDAFDLPLFDRVIEAVRVMVCYLEANVYPDRNIRVLGGQVLTATAWRLAWLVESSRWLKQGVRISNDAFNRQILPDGAHMEAAPEYHEVVIADFMDAWRMARAEPSLGLIVDEDRVAGMHDYSVACTLPGLGVVPLHDTGYRRNPTSIDTFSRRTAFREEAKLADDSPPLKARFAHAGQVFVRDGWHDDAIYLAADAAHRKSWHWHPCRNHFFLQAYGQQLLVDPGYTFKNDEWPRYGHRTSHHNTITLNGLNQARTPSQLQLTCAPGVDLIEGFYGGGYWPETSGYTHGSGVFGEHHRAILWLHQRFIVVIDNIATTSEAGQKPTVEAAWQFGEGDLAFDPARGSACTQNQRGNLHLCWPVVPEGVTATVACGQRDPMLGWVVGEWGQRLDPAPRLSLSVDAYDPWSADFACVLHPFETTPAPITWRGTAPDLTDQRAAGRVEICQQDGARDVIAWTRRLEHAIDGHFDLDTDASLVWLHHRPDGTIDQAIALDATHLDLNGQPVPNVRHIRRNPLFVG